MFRCLWVVDRLRLVEVRAAHLAHVRRIRTCSGEYLTALLSLSSDGSRRPTKDRGRSKDLDGIHIPQSRYTQLPCRLPERHPPAATSDRSADGRHKVRVVAIKWPCILCKSEQQLESIGNVAVSATGEGRLRACLRAGRSAPVRRAGSSSDDMGAV